MRDAQLDRLIRSIQSNKVELSGALRREALILEQPGLWEEVVKAGLPWRTLLVMQERSRAVTPSARKSLHVTGNEDCKRMVRLEASVGNEPTCAVQARLQHESEARQVHHTERAASPKIRTDCHRPLNTPQRHSQARP